LLWLASARLVCWLCSGGWRGGVCTCCSSEREPSTAGLGFCFAARRVAVRSLLPFLPP
jgi:hypothetical protein